MSLEDFKFIYFREYLHRMAARLIGLVFIIPLAWFWLKGKLNLLQKKRAVLLAGLGMLQGFMGWFMVQSGLIDVPFVSPYRLSVHLLPAFLIFACCIWFGLDILRNRRSSRPGFGRLKLWLGGFSVLFVLQLFWGALVAGHKAGYVYNSFPKMNAHWIAPEAFLMHPFWVNLFANIAGIQFMHSLLGTLLLIPAIVLIWYSCRTKSRALIFSAAALFGMLIVQYLSGVFTLLWQVPLWLGVWHQGWAMLLAGVLLLSWHLSVKPSETEPAFST